MIRRILLLLLLTGLAAAPAGAQTSSIPVPPPANGTRSALPHARITATIASHVSAADRQLLDQAWLLSVRQKLLMSWRPLLPDTARYPMGESGTAVLLVQLGRKGVVRHIRVTRSTGVHSLLHAAIGAARSASPYPPFPPGVRARRLRLRLIFRYD